MILTDLTPETPPLTARERRLMDSIEKQSAIICTLKQSLTAAENENARLTDDNETMRRTMQQMQVDEQKVQMYDTLEQYVLDDVDPNTIGIAVVAFVDLRRRKERRT